MSTDKPEVLYPQFYRLFSCIGPKCENDCCHGWKVAIDKKTYETYQQSSDIRIIDTTDRMTSLHRQSDKDYRRIKFNAEGHCPLQNDDGCCHVHARYGEDMLSTTCRTYPRVIRFFNDTPRPTLSLSCPEASRRILLDPHAMTLTPGPAMPDNLSSSIVTDVPPWLDELQQAAFQAVAYKTRTPDERLFHLGHLLQMVAESIEREEAIEPACAEFLRMQANGVISQWYEDTETKLSSLALVIHKLLTESRFFNSNQILRDYHVQFMTDMAEQHGRDGNVDLKELIESRQPALDQLFTECGDGLVNMVRHWIHGDDFCTTKHRLLLRRYALFVLKYVLIRFYLMALAKKDHGSELLVGIVHSVSRSSDHDPLFMLKLYMKLCESDQGSLDSIMGLLKTS